MRAPGRLEDRKAPVADHKPEAAGSSQRIPTDPIVAVFEMPRAGRPGQHGNRCGAFADDPEEPLSRGARWPEEVFLPKPLLSLSNLLFGGGCPRLDLRPFRSIRPTAGTYGQVLRIVPGTIPSPKRGGFVQPRTELLYS